MLLPARIEKRLSCILHLKHQRKSNLRAAERAGRHGSGYAGRWFKRDRAGHSDTDKQRSGWPSKLSNKEYGFIRKAACPGTGPSSAAIATQLEIAHKVKVCSRTVTNYLHQAGFKFGHPERIVSLSRLQRSSRVNWCVAHRNTQKTAFCKVLFTDSKLCTLHPTTGSTPSPFWHPINERPTAALRSSVQWRTRVHGRVFDRGHTSHLCDRRGLPKVTLRRPQDQQSAHGCVCKGVSRGGGNHLARDTVPS
jgi:transposase